MGMDVYVTCEKAALLIDADLMDRILKKDGVYEETPCSVAETFDDEYDDLCDGYHHLYGFVGNVETDSEIVDLVSEFISMAYDNQDIRYIASDAMPMLFKRAYESPDNLISEYRQKLKDAFDIELSDDDILKRLVNIEGWRIA